MSAPKSWGRIRPSDHPWARSARAANGALDARALDAPGGPSLLELRFAPADELAPAFCPSDALMLVTRGELEIAGEAPLRPGELRFTRAGSAPSAMRAGPEGAQLTLLALAGEAALLLGPSPGELPALRVRTSDVAWQEFADPHGRPTEPVRVLFDGGPWVLGARFRPTFSAGEHWHDHDTVYLITAGSMQFGPQEPLYEAGDIRWVRGGHAYGPEQPGPQGVEFTLVSLGGPVNLRWADLEPAPHGRLP